MGWMNHKLESDGLKKYQKLQICKWYQHSGRKQEKIESLRLSVTEESEKAGLKLNIQKSKVTTPGLIPSQQIDGETVGTVTDFYFLGLQNHCKWWLQTLFQKKLAPWKKGCGKSRQCIKKQRHHFANKSMYSQSYGFSSSHIWMWELNHKKGWVLKNRCFCIVLLRKTLDFLGHQRDQTSQYLKGNQHWMFIERTDAEAPILWPPDLKSQFIGKDLDAGKGCRQEEKRGTEDEMVGWHH